jgi:integrase
MPRPKRDVPWLDTRGSTYYVFWYDEGKRATEKLSLRTSDPMLAQKKFAIFLTEGKSAFTAEEGLTVETALDQYYKEHAAKEVVSLVTVENNIRHLKTFFKKKLIKDIGVPECHAYGSWRDVKPSTVAKELSTLKAAARHANKWKRLSLADMPSIRLPKIEVNKGVWLFPDELELLREAATTLIDEFIPFRTLSFIELCYYTGSRREAIESLTWQQVDLERRRISLAKPGERRTKKRRPTIAIDPLLMPTLLRLEKQRVSNWVLGANSRMDNWFRNVARRAGLEILTERHGRRSAVITPHMLRHSRATHLLQDGKPLWAVAGLLGDSLATVEAIYGHHTPLHTESLFDYILS